MTSRWSRRAVITVVVVAVAVVALVVWQRAVSTRDCTAEAVVVDGESYGRDPTRGCRFVNDDGDVLPDD